MNWAAIEAILQREIGLDAHSIGTTAIEAAVRSRQTDCGLTTIESYLDRLRTSPLEVKKLIEEVTVPETWFFRVREAFVFLARCLARQRQAAGSTGRLRLLSVPCSTGEEPYSMAIALLDAGLPPECFRIEAIDINVNALEMAKNAVYGINSFREDDLAFRDEYFIEEEKDRKYRLKERVAATVNFRHGNLVAPDFLAGVEPFDVIFCRNLMIYLEQPARLKVVRTLKRILAEGGLLFVGHAEALPIIEECFVSTRQAGAFAYYNRSPQDDELAPSLAAPPRRKPVAPSRRTVNSPPAPPAKPALPPPLPPAPEEEPLAQAQRLADQGDLDRAAEWCAKAIAKDPLASRAFLLLGVIALAKKDLTLAENHLRKVLYLDARNEEAIRHLIAIYDHRGQHEAAERMKRRIRRVAPETATHE